jgi:hypothetical protein
LSCCCLVLPCLAVLLACYVLSYLVVKSQCDPHHWGFCRQLRVCPGICVQDLTDPKTILPDIISWRLCSSTTKTDKDRNKDNHKDNYRDKERQRQAQRQRQKQRQSQRQLQRQRKTKTSTETKTETKTITKTIAETKKDKDKHRDKDNNKDKAKAKIKMTVLLTTQNLKLPTPHP